MLAAAQLLKQEPDSGTTVSESVLLPVLTAIRAGVFFQFIRDARFRQRKVRLHLAPVLRGDKEAGEHKVVHHPAEAQMLDLLRAEIPIHGPPLLPHQKLTPAAP